jgi:uncharacterized membrane protein
MTSYWPLLGVAVVIVGFALKRNPLFVVVVAALICGVTVRMPPAKLLDLIGSKFVENRSLLLYLLTLPVIGVLERAGLRERARDWILGFARLTLARLLIAYLAVRQLLSMIGLINIAGHPQTVRPLIAPMSEATATRRLGELDDRARDQIRALAAATDNVGVFFGEDAFLAFGGVLLIKGFFDGQNIHLDAAAIALWALPTAGAAFVIHSVRIAIFQLRLEHRLARATADRTAGPASPPAGPTTPTGPEVP